MDCRVDHLVGGDGDGQELVGEVQTGLIVEDGRSTVPGDHRRDHSNKDEQSLCPPVISLYPESVGVPGVVAGGDLEQQRPRLLGVERDIVAIHLHPVPAHSSSGQSRLVEFIEFYKHISFGSLERIFTRVNPFNSMKKSIL